MMGTVELSAPIATQTGIIATLSTRKCGSGPLGQHIPHSGRQIGFLFDLKHQLGYNIGLIVEKLVTPPTFQTKNGMNQLISQLSVGILGISVIANAAPAPAPAPSSQGTLITGGGLQTSPSVENRSAIGGLSGMHTSESGRILAYGGALRARVWNVAHDLDGDGLSDELDADNDNDGLSDHQELLAGTRPNDAKSQLRIAALTLTEDGRVALKWAGHSDWTYRVHVIDGFAHTAKHALRLAPTERRDGPLKTSTYVFEDAHPNSDTRFYRVEIEEK